MNFIRSFLRVCKRNPKNWYIFTLIFTVFMLIKIYYLTSTPTAFPPYMTKEHIARFMWMDFLFGIFLGVIVAMLGTTLYGESKK